jgi:ketosteroid isomerase-like protein
VVGFDLRSLIHIKPLFKTEVSALVPRSGILGRAMSQENVEVVRRVFDASAQRDAETVFSLFDPEAEWDNSRGPFTDLIGAGVYSGHEGLRRFWHEYYAEAWESVEDNLEELIRCGRLRRLGRKHPRPRGASGVEVEWTHNAGVWTIREGKIVRVAWFPTREEALEAVGLRE